jgi:hypothetical protein
MIATPFAGDRIRLIGHPVSTEKHRWMFHPVVFLRSPPLSQAVDKRAGSLKASSPLLRQDQTPPVRRHLAARLHPPLRIVRSRGSEA